MIPKPRKIIEGIGEFRIPAEWNFCIKDPSNVLTPTTCVAALETHLGTECSRFLETDDSDSAQLLFLLGEGIEAEGYRLEIGKNQIGVHASSRAGWFYGAVSLSRLIDDAKSQSNTLPVVSIDDRPEFRWRGMHLDVCRHFFDVEFVKRFLDLMAMHKFNRFHWHLTEDQGWRIDIPSRPLLAEISAWRMENGKPYGGFYTHEQIRDVVQYASERCIEVIPEIETPGHSVAALAAYPELACKPRKFEVETEWGIFDDVYCAGNDATFGFLEEVFDVVVDLFPGRIVHIGGDECPKTRWKECPKCQQRLITEGLRDEEHLQSWFIGRVVEMLAERGRHAIGWDEILEGGLADGALVMSWRGHDGGIEAAQMGHDVVMSPTSHCYFDYWQSTDKSESGFHGINTLKDVFEFSPIPEELNKVQARHVRGGQGNVWTERMYEPADVEYMILPRMCALSEVLWTGGDRDWSDFQSRLAALCNFLAEKNFNFRPLD